MAPPPPAPAAVIFDLDGTLLDTERATRGILKDFLARYGKVPDPEKEEKRLGQMHQEAARAILADYELPLTVDQYSEAIMPLYRERWPMAKALPGVNRLLRHLHSHGIPLGLASNSMKRNIYMKISNQEGWLDYFSVILGVDDVAKGKPSPDIFLEGAKRLGVEPSSCLIVEDSPVGVQAAKASGAQVVAVPSLQGQRQRYTIADVILNSLLEFDPDHWALPPFDDWIQSALPIEPLYLKVKIDEAVSTSCFSISADGNTFQAIADQITGVYLGWAKIGACGVLKMVLSTAWDVSSHPARRMMLVSFIGYNKNVECVTLDLVVCGYIRKLQTTDNVIGDMKITEEDEKIAANALDLPILAEHRSTLLASVQT